MKGFSAHAFCTQLRICLDRIAICEVYWLLEKHYGPKGRLLQRKSNVRRDENTRDQLARMQFHPRPQLMFDSLDLDQKILYDCLLVEYGLAQSYFAEAMEYGYETGEADKSFWER